jgi:hypothetical protein
MRLNTTPRWDGVPWQPYQAFSRYTLPAGTGWQTVYVQTRDRLGRTTVSSDTIYLGSDPDLSQDVPSSTSTTVRLDLAPGNATRMQLSNNWLADDTDAHFMLDEGTGARVNDAQAVGGTAFELRTGHARVWDWVDSTGFYHDLPTVAYVRLSSASTAAQPVVNVSIATETATYSSLQLRGSDFRAANTYQDFGLPFTFKPSGADPYLKIIFKQQGATTVRVDGVRFFTEVGPAVPSYTWAVPGGNYRGGEVQTRFLGP